MKNAPQMKDYVQNHQYFMWLMKVYEEEQEQDQEIEPRTLEERLII